MPRHYTPGPASPEKSRTQWRKRCGARRGNSMHKAGRLSNRSSQTASPSGPACSKSFTTKAFEIGMGNHAMQRRLIQTKLTVNQPGDRFEQEADRVADEVMRMHNARNPDS